MSDGDLRIHITNDPFYMQNGCVVSLRDGGPCWLVDPGFAPQAARMIAYIREHQLTPEKIVLTHAHLDHIAGIDEVREAFAELPVFLAQAEWPMLSDPRENLSTFIGEEITADVNDPQALEPGDQLTLDGTMWQVLDVAGHSPAGRALYCAGQRVVINGDALFAGSIGRTDFPHSNHEQLLANIRENLFALPDDARVLCGHGPETSIGQERQNNPFVGANASNA